jgi:tail assembly chaperone E/41/14-like protein
MITGPITYRLSRPVTSVDREVMELTLREPTGLDMRSCGDQSDAGYTHRLIARLASITPAAVDAMAGRDVIALGRIINRDFLEASDQETLSIDTSSAPGGGAAQ